MAEEVQYKHQERKSEESGYYDAPQAEEHAAAAVEATDRGLFDFGRKKEEKKKGEGEKIASEFENKVQVCEDKKEDHHKEEEKKKHEGLLEKLHRSSSSSSSSSEEEEVGEDGQKKKKKKEKTKGEHKEGKPVEKCEDVPVQEPEEKKGLLGKIKEKLPGGKKPEADAASPPPTPSTGAECAVAPEAEGKEKKGFLDKIKDKIPGYHSKSEEEKEKEKEAASH